MKESSFLVSYLIGMCMYAAASYQMTARVLHVTTLECRIFPVTKHTNLLFLFITSIVILLLSGLGLLPPDATRASSTEWRGKGEVNVLLGVETDDERGDVDDLLSDTDWHVR
jgi:hypothetical protein